MHTVITVVLCNVCIGLHVSPVCVSRILDLSAIINYNDSSAIDSVKIIKQSRLHRHIVGLQNCNIEKHNKSVP